MRRASYFAAAAVLAGLVTSSVLASDLGPRWAADDGVRMHTVAHSGRHGHHGGHSSHYHGRYVRPGYPHGYYHHGRPLQFYPPHPRMNYAPILVPPVYPAYPHKCGPHCGPRCGYQHSPNSFYYRGHGWGFSFGF